QPAGDIVPAHRAGVSGHLRTRPAEQPPYRQTELAPGEVPQRLVDRAQRAVGEVAVGAALTAGDAMPQAFAVEGVLPEQRGTDLSIDHRLTDRVRLAQAVAGRA